MKDNEIRIGALYPLTGQYQLVGRSIRQAMEFLACLINHDELPGELRLPYLGGKKVRLVWGNTGSDPIMAQNETRRLISEEGAAALLGCYQSDVTAVASIQAEVYGIPFLSPDTAAASLTQRGLRYFFRTGPDSLRCTRSLFDMLFDLGVKNKTIGIICGNSLLGQDEVQALLHLSKKYGHKVTAICFYTEDFPATQDDLLVVKEACPDLLILPQNECDAVKVIGELKESDFCPFALLDQTSFFAAEGQSQPAGEYVIGTAAWAEGLTRSLPLAREMNDLFKSKNGTGFDNAGALGFTGLYVLLDAIGRAGTTRSGAVREALSHTELSADRLILPWEGIRFDRNGQNTFADSLVVQTICQDPVIVWPEEIAQRRTVLPIPHGQ